MVIEYSLASHCGSDIQPLCAVSKNTSIEIFRPALLTVQIQTKPHWATQICFSITEFDQAWSAMDQAVPDPPDKCALQIDTQLMFVKKLERWIFLKVSVFYPQYFSSFWLNLFCFTHPVWTFKHLLCFTVTPCSLLAHLRVIQTHNFLQMLFHNESSWMTK